MFGKPKLDMIDIKRYLSDRLRSYDYITNKETENGIEYTIIINERRIVINLMLYKNKKLVVDVTDSYYLLRIPRGEFKNLEDYKNFVLQVLDKINR